MNIKKFFSILAIMATTLFTTNAHADVHYDAHGNVGYDTAAECDAAVQAGTAKFYQPFTQKSPLLRKGEKKVAQAALKDLGEQYATGACDIGVGKKAGRDGVSSQLQGKFIPFSPDMPINVYLDAAENATRVTMGQCDNWFSGNAPRPVAAAPAVAPTATTTEKTIPAITPIVTGTVMPYVFGTIGMHSEHLDANGKQPSFYNRGIYDDTSNTLAAQAGVGLQFNPYVGGELFAESGAKKKYTSTTHDIQKIKRATIGARATLGTNANKKARVFAKAGVAAVHQDDFHPQFTAGLGALYKITDKTAIRADYDHYFKRSKHVYYDNMGYSKSHYVGIGLQHNFK